MYLFSKRILFILAPMTPQQQLQQLRSKLGNINPANLDNLKCVCGCVIWEKITIAKVIPGIMAGTPGQNQLMQLDTLRCIECKKIMPEAEVLIGKKPEPQKA